MRLAEMQQEHKRKKESTAPYSRKIINLLTRKKNAMGKKYRALEKKKAARKKAGLNAHGQHGYNDAYFLLGAKEIPEGPQKPFASQRTTLLTFPRWSSC